MNQRERMLSGLPYKAWLDGLEEDRKACKQKIYDFNQLPPSRQSKEAPQMIKNIFGKTGENVWVEAPFHCDYGLSLIHISEPTRQAALSRMPSSA